MERILAHNSYFAKRVGALALIFVVIQMFLRVSLLVWEYNEISLSLAEFLEMLAVGLVYDAATFSYFMIAYVFYVAILPSSLHLKKIDVVITSVIYFALLYLLLFDVVAEWVFWDEFSVRFNFIAVDYLVYTQEVLENIWQSYHVVSILIAVALTALVTYYVTKHMLLPRLAGRIMPFRVRLAYAIAYLLVPLSFFFFMDLNKAEVTTNNYANEITKNGVYSLFSAFFNNEISYEKFYLSGYGEAELPPIRTLLEENELGQYFIGNDADDITRFVPSQVTEKKKNVIIVVMESMSAEYMEHFGNEEKITPNLDRLADSAIFFEKTYATGTRTVRGLEAISLSVPPSAGRSIIKKKGNEELASIGYVFKDKGYDTRFIYGGYGYFDNMNYFFSHNGFDIVDRNDFESAEQHFANAWGVSDEDLFTKVIKVADASYEQKKPFMHMVMTTSNHRPYTFPENIAGIPTSGGGRPAGVKYADYAIGKFIEAAESKPWFKDTVFVFVADHTAGSAGKSELSVKKYHIPLIIYSPSFLEARVVPNLTSQIDVAPILLGLLDFSYYSRFYGENILHDSDEQAHAFVANYQKLGFISNDMLVVLKPGKKYAVYKDEVLMPEAELEENLLLEAISYYKHASNWREHISRIKPEKVLE